MKPFFFIHVPKTGGGAIYDALDINDRDHAKASSAPQVFTFAFVRNPYERIRSAFHFMTTVEPVKFHGVTFRDFLLGAHEDLWTGILFRSMTEQLDAPVSFIGRFETLQRDFTTVCSILDISTSVLARVHVSQHKEPYDFEMRCFIRSMYADDFTRYGY